MSRINVIAWIWLENCPSDKPGATCSFWQCLSCLSSLCAQMISSQQHALTFQARCWRVLCRF